MTDLRSLYDLADSEYITVDGFDLGNCESLSILDDDGSCYIAIDPFKLQSTADETTKLAHELGHCMTGSFYNRWSSFDVRQQHENRADKWAIEHLISKDELANAVASGYTEVWELADYFCVDESFMRKAVCWYQNGNLSAM